MNLCRFQNLIPGIHCQPPDGTSSQFLTIKYNTHNSLTFSRYHRLPIAVIASSVWFVDPLKFLYVFRSVGYNILLFGSKKRNNPRRYHSQDCNNAVAHRQQRRRARCCRSINTACVQRAIRRDKIFGFQCAHDEIQKKGLAVASELEKGSKLPIASIAGDQTARISTLI